MSDVWFILLGVVIGAAAMTPLTRLLLRRAERRARDAERRATRAERLAELGEMTSGLAHEIKNPLSTVGLNAQLLTEGLQEANLDEEEKGRLLRRLSALAREVERLGGILTDFLQFAGRIRLDATREDVGELLEQLSDFFHPQCDQANVLLRVQIPDHPVVVSLDESLFKQALLNLMINALHAMTRQADAAGDDSAERGELMLHLVEHDDHICVHVIDTGPGIAEEQLNSIFRPYVSGRKGGTGLGLPTARRIIEEHGGSLQAHSDLGQGSDFVITLPKDPGVAAG